MKLQARPISGEESHQRAALTRHPTSGDKPDAEIAGLVCKIVLDSAPPEHDDADRHDGKHLVVALECGLDVPCPFGLEGDLGGTLRLSAHLAAVSPGGHA